MSATPPAPQIVYIVQRLDWQYQDFCTGSRTRCRQSPGWRAPGRSPATGSRSCRAAPPI